MRYERSRPTGRRGASSGQSGNTDWLGIVAVLMVGTFAALVYGSSRSDVAPNVGGGTVVKTAVESSGPARHSSPAMVGEGGSASASSFSDDRLDAAFRPAPNSVPARWIGMGSNLGHELRPRLLSDPGEPSHPYVPSQLPGMKDAWDPRVVEDSAIFWDVPFSGGSVALDVMRSCHRLKTTGMRGNYEIHDGETELKIVYPGRAPPGRDRTPFINVDTSTVPGISRARQLGLGQSSIADVIVTPLVYESDTLFSEDHPARGRLFAIFRHPIERAADLFYYMKHAHWEPTYTPEVAAMSIDQYAKSNLVEDNWMTRQLSGQLSGELTQDHLTAALEVLRTKFLVGLHDHLGESMDRFDRYFGWTFRMNPANQEQCRNVFIKRGVAIDGGGGHGAGKKHKELEEGTEAFEAIFWHNQMDLEIYDYAVMLFKEQVEFVAETPENFRTVGATCCRCNPPTFPQGFECPQQ